MVKLFYEPGGCSVAFNDNILSYQYFLVFSEHQALADYYLKYREASGRLYQVFQSHKAQILKNNKLASLCSDPDILSW